MKSALIAVVCASAVVICTGALAQYPTKPITMVVPVAAGGATDVVGRIVAREMEARLKRPVIVTNNAGAGGIIGTDSVARAAPDGYTLLFAYPGVVTVVPALQPQLPYDPEKSLMPVNLLARTTFVLSVHPSVRAGNLREFVLLAKAEPGKLNYGSGGVGTTSHLAMELFKYEAGVDIVHVPFKGAGPASNLLLAGGLSASFENIATALPRFRNGELRSLGVSSPERSPLAPDIPTVSEAGVKGFEVVSWFGVMLPAGTAREAFDRISETLSSAMRTPEFRKRLTDMGLEPVGTDAETFRAQIASEIVKWRRVVKEAKITAQ